MGCSLCRGDKDGLRHSVVGKRRYYLSLFMFNREAKAFVLRTRLPIFNKLKDQWLATAAHQL